MRMVLIDGEHYPDVTAWAIKKIGDVSCAVFLGGTEKIGDMKSLEEKIGVKLYYGESYISNIKKAINENKIEEVIDLSDEPVLNYEDRFRIAAVLLKHGIKYKGADFEFSPKEMIQINKPSLTILGTGKRVGKTAISGFIARTLKEISKPIIVTMGRGGPEEPEIIEGNKLEITPDFLVKVAESGKHAASDHFEDALTSRVLTIGCRRCGGGMAGFSFFDIVNKGIKLAEKLEGDIVILEGSGATFPAVKADKYITVVGATQRIEFIKSYFGPFRIGLADLIVVTLADMISKEKIEKIQKIIEKINPDAEIHLTAFKPRPLSEIRGKKAILVMTAPPEGLEKAAAHLENHYDVEIIGKSANLANRPKLIEDLSRFKHYDTVLVELKAAAVDIVTREALKYGKEVIYIDNEPVNIDNKNLREAVLEIGWELKGERK